MNKTCGKEKYPNLFSPIRVGNLRFKNRIIAAPTSPSMITPEGYLMPESAYYLGKKAAGGAALVDWGEAIVHVTGQSHSKQVRLDVTGVRTGLSYAAKMIHNNGALAGIQLSHGGMYGGLTSVGGSVIACDHAWGPSACVMPNGEKVEEMPREIIDTIIKAFADGAKLCKECGYDIVQVHAAHGWLFSQFLSPVQNKRTDEFGGSLENRARFLVMTLKAIREAVGPMFPIEVRLAGDDYADFGVHLEEEIEVAKMIDGIVDIINVSCGHHEVPELFTVQTPSGYFEKGCYVGLAAEIKKHVKCLVSCMGAVKDVDLMEEIIASGKADFVMLGRPLLADPFLPEKALEGNTGDITPCIRCYECFGETQLGEAVKCSVNPCTGNEMYETPVGKAEIKKKALVVGGGPGGMQAAITLRERGHEVTLVEKSDHLGGNLIPAGSPFGKSDVLELNEVLKRRVERSGAKVLLNTKADEEFVKDFNPDVMFLAVGAREVIPPIKGIDMPNVISASEAELHPEKAGEKVVIIGGGLVGCEAAVSFAHNGHKASVIEMRNEILLECNFIYKGALEYQIKKNNVDVYTGAAVKEINQTGVVFEKDGVLTTVEADTVVYAVGFKAPYDFVDKMCDLVQNTVIIGDCKKVGQIGNAIDQAYHMAKIV
jgi:2,4-dienoyl-CoA reductase-like NADH-dependent reductase (Old Yellow Enzyme family)/thioredoxin reductase